MSKNSNTQIITDDERRRRQEACDYAHASVRLEGFELSQADKDLAIQFIAGEVGLDEFLITPKRC